MYDARDSDVQERSLVKIAIEATERVHTLYEFLRCCA
jgi:hypothetical protein